MTSSRAQRRQLERRRAREEARRAAERAARRRRLAMIVFPVVVVVLALLAFLLTRDDGGDAVVVGDDTTDTTGGENDAAEAAEAAGPCVPVSEPLPPGAPEVPVREGPPPTELVKEDLVVGEGEEVQPGDTVTAHYIGVACSTGKIFDSSWSRGEPSPFSLNQVVEGWRDGIPGMKVGGRRLLGIPYEQAYGEAGRPPDIGPREALWFVVDVVATERG